MESILTQISEHKLVKLLLVEDSPAEATTFSQLLGKLFTSGSFQARISPSLADAMMEIKTYNPDLIFLDLTLKDSEDWRETLKVIKGAFASYPVFVLTGLEDPSMNIMAESFKAGARGFFLKPFLMMGS